MIIDGVCISCIKKMGNINGRDFQICVQFNHSLRYWALEKYQTFYVFLHFFLIFVICYIDFFYEIIKIDYYVAFCYKDFSNSNYILLLENKYYSLTQWLSLIFVNACWHVVGILGRTCHIAVWSVALYRVRRCIKRCWRFPSNTPQRCIWWFILYHIFMCIQQHSNISITSLKGNFQCSASILWIRKRM